MTAKSTFFTRMGTWARNPLQAFRDTSLGTKLILLFLAVTVAVAGPVFYLTITGTTNALTEQVGEGLAAVAETQGQNIGTILAQRVRTMQAFTQDPDLLAALAAQNDTYTGNAAAIEAELLNLDDQWVAAGNDDTLVNERLESDLAHKLDSVTVIVPDFAEVFVTDRYGGLVAASDRTSDYYQADEGWWQSAYNEGQGGVFIAEPEIDESAGVVGIDMAVPVYAAGSDEIIGIMRTTLDATAMLTEFRVEIGQTGAMDLVFPAGTVFATGGGGHEEDKEETHTVDPAVLAQLNADPHGHIDAVYDEVPSLVARGAVASVGGEDFVSDMGWNIVVHQHKDEALAPVYQTRNTTVITVGVIGLLAVVAAVFVGRAVANPILKLTETVKQFATGDRSVRTESKSADEIGTLTNSFNTMAEEVDTLMTDIETRSEELAERTRELEASQRVTFAASERVTPDELLDLVVNLIRDQFDLYHAQVYLVDEEENAAVLKQSTGYAGRQLLTRRHKIPLDATSLVTKAIHTGEPVLVADTTQDPNFMANPLLPETRSELVVPLKLKDEIIGVMDAQDRTPGRFSPSTVNLFQSMADQVAILFENSELLERITEQTESLTVFTNQLRTAAEIARRMGTILDPERLLEQTVEMLQSRFGLYHAHIYVLDDANQKLIMRSGSGEVGRVLRKQGHAISLDAEKSLVARAARNEQSVLVNDTSQESDFMPNPLLSQTRSEVAIPLISGDKVMGVLDIQDDQPDRFSEADIDTFGTLAGQIATALQTAGIFEQTQVRLRINQALSGAHTEKEVLDVLIEQAGFYPKTQVMIFTDEWEEEERFSALRRAESFDSRLVSRIQPGIRLPSAQFQLVTEYTRTDGLFVSSNLPEDEHADPMAREMAKQMGTRSMAIVPVKIGDEQIGSISISSEEEAYLDEEKLHLYRTLAEQGATALQIARLNDGLQRSLQETQIRLDVSQSLAGAQTEEDVLDVLIQHMEIYPNTRPTIFTAVPEAEEMTLAIRRQKQYGCSLPQLPEGLSIPISQFPTLKNSVEGKISISSNIAEDESADPAARELARQTGTCSELSIPLMAGGQYLGVIAVSSPAEGYFDEEKLHLYQTLAEQGATALRIARLNDENIRTAERLREVDRLKSEFLASMSHELRTPLNSIIGYTEIMLMGLDTELDPEMTEDVQAIYDNGQHLLRIINDVLDLAKIEAGRLELNQEEVPVEALVDAASSSVTGLLVNKEKPVEFRVEVEDNLPTILGDQVRLNQVINNLASNAVKFTDEGHITLRAFRDDGWICLEVEDTGIGIAEEDLSKIFERFQQVDGSNARKQEGTGLGLAITRHLVQMHGGTIKVKSKVGEGSTFTVRLPAEHNGTDAVADLAEEAPDTAAPKARKTPPVSQKASAAPETGASEPGVSLSPSDIVDMLLE
jgi:signal transduction histidine kinase/HAMP domain-containing protein